VGGQIVSMIVTNRPVGARAYTSATTVNSGMRPGSPARREDPLAGVTGEGKLPGA
jgi:hypothetical protein